MTSDVNGKYGCYIGGEFRCRDKTFTVDNPATGEPLSEVAEGGREGIDSALTAAKAALSEWQQMDPQERGRILRSVGDAVRADVDRLARIETAETGRPLSQSQHMIESAAKYFEYYAGLTDKIQGETVPLGEGYLDYTLHEPLGVVGQIIPWNAPTTLASRGIAPALACGNTVVAKPAPEAPITVLELTRLANAAGLPDGVWNAVPGDGAETGAGLTDDDRVDKVVFTGSTATGRIVAKAAMDDFTPVGLETGGKSPSIVFPEADVRQAADDTLAVFNNAGQVCFATTRVFVHEDIYDEFIDYLVPAVEDLTIGPGKEDPDVGPLITEAARDSVDEYVDGALEDGGRLLVGGEIPLNRGHFYAPTVVDSVADDAPISCDEVFGPVLTVYEFSTEEEVVRRANDTNYGLYATVWTGGLSRAHRVASELDAGNVTVNEFPVTAPQAPFGGYKESGLGREKGIQAIEEYTQLKNVIVSLDT